eukprot:g5847.t1
MSKAAADEEQELKWLFMSIYRAAWYRFCLRLYLIFRRSRRQIGQRACCCCICCYDFVLAERTSPRLAFTETGSRVVTSTSSRFESQLSTRSSRATSQASESFMRVAQNRASFFRFNRSWGNPGGSGMGGAGDGGGRRGGGGRSGLGGVKGRRRATHFVAKRLSLSPSEVRYWELEKQFVQDRNNDSRRALQVWWIILTLASAIVIEVLEYYMDTELASGKFTGSGSGSDAGTSSMTGAAGYSIGGGGLNATAATTAAAAVGAAASSLSSSSSSASSSSSSAHSLYNATSCLADVAWATQQVDQMRARAYQLRIGRMIKGCVTYPCMLVYIGLVGGGYKSLENLSSFFRATEHNILTGCIMLLICVSFVCQAVFSDRRYAYFFLIFLFLFALAGTIKHVQQVVVTTASCGMFVLLTAAFAKSGNTGAPLMDQNWTFAFFFQFLLPVVFVSLVGNHGAERRLRKVFLKIRAVKRQMDEIEKNFERAQNLLARSFPPPIAEILRKGEHPIIDGYGTILFADLVSFTTFSSTISAKELVRMLDHMFIMFDALAGRFDVTKIKTIGDCYVAGTGVLQNMPDHAIAMIDMGLGMLAAMEVLRDTHEAAARFGLQLRIGIHSGPVVGGIVGHRKFVFDVWGKTVFVANNMESQGVAGRVHVSDVTYLRGKKNAVFEFEPRGPMNIEGVDGEMNT